MSMKLYDLMTYLNQVFPFEISKDWDNSGRQIADDQKTINRIVIGIDLTDKLLDKAIETNADLIITHHPFIFSPLKRVNITSYKGDIIKRMIVNDISSIALHTNYDLSIIGMGQVIGSKIGLVNLGHLVKAESFKESGFGSVGDLEKEVELNTFIDTFKNKFQLEYVTLYNENAKQTIKKVAFCGGAGADFILDAINMKADIYITGDITHHDAQAAYEGGIILMDPTHYGLEKVFIDHLSSLIADEYSGIELIPYQVNEFKAKIR
ncbi:MAG: Dinuclear metal center protein, YbgI family [Clostridiales bacterium 38_11]|nr:MAG: Dinuclear metal center protein, YbgI family [Clostridiales bacterium 38_11]HBH13480.1 Nif3-like dinuclear metal center hexameric protein [Clostridiales bacterium]